MNMRDERVKLIIKNMDLLLKQLKLEFEEDHTPEPNKPNAKESNMISIQDLLMPEDYVEPEYYEESDNDLPNVSIRWRNDDV